MQTHSLSVPTHNLVDSLFADRERSSEHAQGFARAVTRPDLGITRVLVGRAFGHWMSWEKDSGVEFDHHPARRAAQLFEYGGVVVPVGSLNRSPRDIACWGP
jgi:hypothetical protein